MIDLDAFGNRIALLRQSAHLTQVNLAKAVGVSRGSVANMERGAQEPSLRVFAALAQVLGVTCDSLLGTDETTADPLPWHELARRVTASERQYRQLADQHWADLDVNSALVYRGMAEGLELAREHHLAVVAMTHDPTGLCPSTGPADTEEGART